MNTMRLLSAWLVLVLSSPTFAVSGASMAYRSSGSSNSGDWTLNENGYVGTYVTLPTAGNVTISVNASGLSDGGSSPRMNMVIDDFSAGFDVQSGFNTYQHTFSLSAGTHFFRTEFANDVPSVNRQMTVRSVLASGATITNTASDANALAAADTYIANYRQGQVNVALGGVAPGSTVKVKMTRNAFNFGTMVQGFDANVFLAPLAQGDTTSTAARYQSFVNSHFNTLVPSNMGKWDSNEGTQNTPTMDQVDTILNYASAHHMSGRMHTLIWGNQQPSWVNALISNAKSSDSAVSGPAKTALMNAISNRIAYYVGDGDSDTTDGDRSRKYIELDVLNEALREGTYQGIFGDHDIAQIYKNVKGAVTGAGANTAVHKRIQCAAVFDGPCNERVGPIRQLVSARSRSVQQRWFRAGRHGNWRAIRRRRPNVERPGTQRNAHPASDAESFRHRVTDHAIGVFGPSVDRGRHRHCSKVVGHLQRNAANGVRHATSDVVLDLGSLAAFDDRQHVNCRLQLEPHAGRPDTNKFAQFVDNSDAGSHGGGRWDDQFQWCLGRLRFDDQRSDRSSYSEQRRDTVLTRCGARRLQRRR